MKMNDAEFQTALQEVSTHVEQNFPELSDEDAIKKIVSIFNEKFPDEKFSISTSPEEKQGAFE